MRTVLEGRPLAVVVRTAIYVLARFAGRSTRAGLRSVGPSLARGLALARAHRLEGVTR